MSREAEDVVVYDDEIDLRAYVTVLLRWKWVITGIVVLAIVAAGLLSLTVMTPTYEATQLVALPAARGQGLLEGSIESRLGMSAEAYQEYATSVRVMEHVYELVESRLSTPSSPTSLRKRFEAKVDEKAGLLEVTARASTGEEAYWLAQAWLEAFQSQVLDHLREQVSTSVDAADHELEEANSGFRLAQRALESFDREYGLALVESRLAQMERELNTAEARLRSLTLDLLPAERARLEFLEAATEAEPTSLEVPVSQTFVPESSPGGTVIGAVTVLNPAYLRYSEDLAATRARIVSYETELASLREKIALLPVEINTARGELISLEAERDHLNREFKLAETRLLQAQQRRDTLSPLASRITDLGRIVPVSPATVPESPVAPRPMLNMAVAAVLAGFASVFYAFLREWWKSGGAATVPVTESPTTVAASDAKQEKGT